jgi:hypothetical protein
MKTNTARTMLLSALTAAVITLGLTGCNTSQEHPSEHPEKAPTTEHPSEHPSS